MKVEFIRSEGGQYSVHIHRLDGVVVSLGGADRRYQVPHDMAHLATERALGMSGGVFGSVASGAMFDGMAVVSGRVRHDPKRRSQDVLRANTKARTITVAEAMTALVHGAVEHGSTDGLVRRGRELWGTAREDPFPFTPEQFQTAVEHLRTLSDRWTDIPVGGALEVEWPDELVTRHPARARSKVR